MKAFTRWLKSNSAALLIAGIGVLGSFAGAYLGSSSQEVLWRREKVFQYNAELVNKRVQILNEINKSRVYSQRVRRLVSSTEPLVASAALQKCQTETAGCSNQIRLILDLLAVNKEIADRQADFFTAMSLASLYFCSKTREAMKSISNRKIDWWELDDDLWSNLDTAMRIEVTCADNALTSSHSMFR